MDNTRDQVTALVTVPLPWWGLSGYYSCTVIVEPGFASFTVDPFLGDISMVPLSLTTLRAY